MGQKPIILGVDDNVVNLTILRELLAADYDFFTAEGGEEAIELALTKRPDLILLDIMMPGIDGYETCRKMREHAELKHSKIVLVSAKGTLSERMEGYEAGADDYIVKPFDHDELMAKVKVYLRLKSSEEIESVKSRVLEVLQHGTRTPLTSIIGYAELLDEAFDLTEEERTEAPKVIIRNARRLQVMLEKAERLAAMRSRSFAFQMQEVSLRELVEDTLGMVESRCGEGKIQLFVGEDAIAPVDRRQMMFSLEALIDNAFIHGGVTSRVDVSLAVDDGLATITVADNGQGLDQQLLPRALFDPFSDVKSVVHNRGDGLSLPIVEQVALAHRGMVFAMNREDAGAEFTLQVSV